VDAPIALLIHIVHHWRRATDLQRSADEHMYKLTQTFFVAVFACGSLNAQTNVWQPSPGHTQVPIWPRTVPDAQPVPGPESYTTTTNLIAGKPCVLVVNVSQPTMTVYSPKGRNTGVAVVVFPGGGYNCLAIDLEGTEICDWLTSKGITGVLLKYRVPDSGPHGLREPKAPTALRLSPKFLHICKSQA